MRNKNLKVLEIGTVLPLSVKFILEKVKEEGNPPIYYWKLSNNILLKVLNIIYYNKRKNIKIGWKLKKYIYLSNMWNFKIVSLY